MPKSSSVAFIVHPLISKKGSRSTESDLDNSIEEITGLTEAIGLQTGGVRTVKMSQFVPATLLGKGVIDEILTTIEDLKPEIVIINHALSPVQQRNLEKKWQIKVIDRTGLILEIFGARAQTKEGRIQVELAALDYQRSRLVRSWTHLERQRGGAGFMGGPGETQLEIDRRIITDKIASLKKDLEKVRKTRELGRQSRERVPFPIVALVGYTNAGKSTLFNLMTKANVFAEDLLFATLDPTMRGVSLSSGQKVILSDTVGFIADLPTMLIESFQATLEQISYADIILHVRDMARPDNEKQKQDVVSILKELGVDYDQDERIFEIFNKIDNCNEDQQLELHRLEKLHEKSIVISAKNGQGIKNLLSKIENFIERHQKIYHYSLDPCDGKALSWLYSHGEIHERIDQADYIALSVSMGEDKAGQFRNLFNYDEQGHKVSV